MNVLTKEHRIKIRAAVNDWMMATFPVHRKYLCHEQPHYNATSKAWMVTIGTKNINGHSTELGRILIGSDAQVIPLDSSSSIKKRIDALLKEDNVGFKFPHQIKGKGYAFSCGDGIKGAEKLEEGEINLLLTDPPYGISKSYNCEAQVPRRLRTNGRDFIMPKGHFGKWDEPIKPDEWLDVVLPKVSGWVVSFCSQAQIHAYQECLARHKFVAIGTLVWQKTNPVPFNHRYKPVNAWEAVVVGKRPNTIFNGEGVVHNVFKHKSPSPQARIHPTQKPLGLMRHFVRLFSQEGDVVYEPFAGSGTTIIAAALLGRRAVGYEMDEAIYQLACARMKKEIDGLTLPEAGDEEDKDGVEFKPSDEHAQSHEPFCALRQLGKGIAGA